jgi:conjugal transfer pilus assembly protein TraW
MIRKRKKALIILMAVISAPALGKDFGTRGHTYKIIEQPFLQMMDERLKKVDIEAERKKMEENARDRIHNPKPVDGIIPSTKSRTFYYDPTFTLDEDVVLPCGKILHKAGTKVNPLEHMQLNRRMFFVDSRKPEQVKWLKAQLNNPLPEQVEPVQDKIILVGGSPLKLKEELDAEVYYDQQGALSTKFGIKHSPAIVQQDGLLLRIEEIKLTNTRG